MAERTDVQSKLTQRSFFKGMNLDSLPSSMPEGYYRESFSNVIETENENTFGVASESSNELFSSLPEGAVPRGYYFVEEREHHYFFSNIGGKSEIGYVDAGTKEYVKVYDDCQEVLDFGMDTWIPIEGKVMQPCNELHLYWAVRDYYFRLNVDNTEEIETCDDLYLFQPNCVSPVKVDVTEKGGVNLYAGSYDVVAQLEDEDGNVTNWFSFGDTVYLGSENNKSSETSEQGINIRINNLGKDYVKVNLAVFYNGTTVGKMITSLPYSSNGVEYFYSSTDQFVRDVPIEEVLGRNNGYPRGADLMQYDGRLFLYNIRGERNLDYQERALNIKPTYAVGRVPMKYAHQFRGLRRNETYAVGIHWNYVDGTRTRVFHIGNIGKEAPSGTDCTGCGGLNAGNNAEQTSSNGDVFEESLSSQWDRESPSEEYVPFEPTEQNQYTFEDADYPDYSDVPNPAAGGNGDDCDCKAYCQLSNQARGIIGYAIAGVSINQGLLGGPFKPASASDIQAAFDIIARKCDCDCEAIAEGRSQDINPSEGITYNDDDVARIQAELDLQIAVDGGEVTTEDIQNYLDTLYTYDANGPGLEGSLEAELRSSGDEEDPDPETGTPGTFGEEECEENDGQGADMEAVNLCDSYDTSQGGDSSVLGDFSDSISHNTETHRENNNETGQGVGTESTVTGERTPFQNDCEPEIIIKEGTCCEVEKVIPCIDARGELSGWESCETYPTTKRCDSEEYVYGEMAGKPIKHLKLPSSDIEPPFISYNDGVPTADNRDNVEEKDTFARFLWLEFDNIETPSEDELDKPLCKENPFTISIVKRTMANKSVIASGLARGVFGGDIYGEPHLYPRHGVNSPETVSRYIENEQTITLDDGSERTLRRLGGSTTDAAYTFLSPDTAFDRPNLNVDRVKFSLDLFGRGFRHGLYAEGEAPESMFLDTQHTKGARASVNLNHFRKNGEDRCLRAASFAPADSIVDKGENFSKSLVNLGRESSVYFETDGSLIERIDESFFGDVNQHQRILRGEGLYAEFIREIPNQYGRLENLSYIPIYQGTRSDLESGKFIAEGGDSFINLYSVKTTSYVSDRVGTLGGTLEATPEESGGISNIPIIGGLTRWILRGQPVCGTIPEQGPAAAALDPRANNDLNGLGPDRDTYFVQLQKTLITFPVESDVNLYYRGGGTNEATAHYRDLNGMDIDSSFGGNGGDYDRSYLDEYYATMTELSPGKRFLRALINLLFTYGVGIYFIIRGFSGGMETLSDLQVGLTNSVGAGFALASSVLIFLIGIIWIIVWSNTNLDNRFWDKILGIKDCTPDKKLADGQYAMEDRRVVWKHRPAMKDEYYNYEYNSFSRINDFDINLGLPFNYNTCDCLVDKTYQILYSDKQNPTSWRDAYRNFRVNNYIEIPNRTGRMTKMFKRSNKMYVQTTDMMWSLESGSTTLDTAAGSVYLGRGQLLQNPIAVFDGPHEGFAGNLDPNASINTKWGHIWIDREARKVYRFSGQLEELGEGTMRNFLRENLDFKFLDYFPDYSLVDEKIPNGIGYSIGVDYRHDRILITKNDYIPKAGVDISQVNGDGTCIANGQEINLGDSDYFDDCSWTLSYSFMIKNFVSFHYYKPMLYLNDRYDMYTMDGNNMWVHNVDGKHRSFYGKLYPWSINFTAYDKETRDTFQIQDAKFFTESRTWDGETYIEAAKVPFEKITAYNTYQSTGEMTPLLSNDDDALADSMDYLDTDLVPLFWMPNHSWRANQFTNKLIDDNVRIFEPFKGGMPRILNESNLQEEVKDDNLLDIYVGFILSFTGEENQNILFKNAVIDIDTETL